jgi:hypothetical protein
MKSEAVNPEPPEVLEANLAYLGKGFPALHQVRDETLILRLGNAFLCEEIFLKKIGASIDSQLEKLRQEILSLKMKFPGKFTTEIDTDSVIEDLRSHAGRLQNPNKGIIDKCTIGALGREMEGTLGALTTAMRTIKRKVEGETPSYTARDSVLGVLGKAKTPASAVTRLVSVAIRTVLILVLLSLGPLAYLVLTLDREATLQKDIAEAETHIQSQREIVLSMEQEREALHKKIEDMKADDAPREVKEEVMELDVKLHSLDQNRNRAEAEITIYEGKIKDMKRRLEQVKNKPFLDRLLRR